MNDKKILELRAVIEAKKAKFEKIKFSPVTNCSIELEEKRYNLNVLNKDSLTLLLVRLNTYLMSMENLGIKELFLSGYPVQEWVEDIKNKLQVIAQKTEEDNLKALESKLGKLLSEDKKTELELSNIENLLK